MNIPICRCTEYGGKAMTMLRSVQRGEIPFAEGLGVVFLTLTLALSRRRERELARAQRGREVRDAGEPPAWSLRVSLSSPFQSPKNGGQRGLKAFVKIASPSPRCARRMARNDRLRKGRRQGAEEMLLRHSVGRFRVAPPALLLSSNRRASAAA